MRTLPFLVLAGACATAVPIEATPDAANPQPGTPDAPATDPEPPTPPAGTGTALLITEVSLAPAANEFIELANPTPQTIDLSSYYLSDSGKYFQLPAGGLALDTSDFIVRFPAGATIAPGAVITVALDTAANFQAAYGIAPTFSVASGTMTAVLANGTPTLTNAGEVIVVFQWNGQSDLVRDVDLLLVGVPSTANGLLDKSALAFDGPDGDTTASSYGSDMRTISAQPTAPGAGLSTKRIALETGFELQTGAGNGLAGDDETSEDTSSTWDSSFTAPTPGALPTGLMQ